MQRLSLLIIFLLSGMAALIHQVVWVRQATLIFGVSVYAYSAVLAAFMGGAAVGSIWLGKRADRVKSPLVIYAALQIGIAFLGALAPFILTLLMPLYATIAQWLAPGSAWITATRAYLAILALTPPSLLIGATLPFIARAFTRQAGRVGSDIGALYAADTLGAALGCGLAGLFLLRLVGVHQTAYVAAGLNVLAALGALWVAQRDQTQPLPADELPRSTPPKSTKKGKRPPDAPPLPAAQPSSFTTKFVLIAYALSGFIALGYEVVWARILAIFTLNAIFSFSIMLTTFLIGLTVGGWIGAWWTRRRRVTVMHFANLEIAVGLTALLTLFIFALVPNRITLETTVGVGSVTKIITFEFLMGFLTFFVPTTLLGMLFPVVTSLYTGETTGAVGAQIGRVYAFNTAGAILGSLLVGFVAIPLIGLQATAATLAVLNLIIGVVASWVSLAHSMQSRLIPQGGMALGIVLILLLPPGYYLGFRADPTEQMKYYGEGPETTVAVFDVPDQKFKVSFVNGRIEVPTDEISMRAFRLLGHLPALLKPEAKRALMLSFGNGIATGSLDTHNIPRIDAVDLSAEQFKAAELYWQENYNVLRSQRLHIFVEDGRNFLLQTPDQYDIITTDATHPVNASSWALFTKEFYERVAMHLTKDGVFMQWLPFHNLREADYQKIIRTFQAVFPNATLWYTGGSHTLLLATPYPLTQERLASSLSTLAGAETVVAADLGSPQAIQNYLVMDADKVRAYVGNGALVTDNDAFFLPYNGDNQRILQMLGALQKAQ